MKYLHAAFIFIVSLSASAQTEEAKPQFLKEPADWAFERFTLPPSFEPAFPYKGVEELRFAPGMFKKDSATYFTYAFVAQLDNVTAFSQDDTRDYLLRYFKGLCSSVAKDRKLVIDTALITVAVEKKKGLPTTETIYTASLNIFGVFVDGASVKLNAEVKILINTVAKNACLIFITSPREKNDAIWKMLYKIQKEFTISN